MSDFKNHGDKPIEFCGDQEGWIAVGSLTDDSPLSPCYPRVVLLGVGLGPSGKEHPSNIAAMLTIAQATDLRARLTDAMAVDRPAPTPTPAPGLDLDAVERAERAMAPGPWRHVEVLADGELIRDEVCDADGNIGGAGADFQDVNAAGIVAIRNAAPALIAEVRALRADKAALLKHIDYNPSLRIRECEALRAKLAEAKRLGMEACAVASAIAGDRIACDAAGIAAIAAALEAL